MRLYAIRWRGTVVCLLFAALPAATCAYEVGTHAKITNEAYRRSSLFAVPKLSQLGLFDLNYVLGLQQA